MWRLADHDRRAGALSQDAIRTLEANAGVLAPGVVDFIKNTWPAANDTTSKGKLTIAAPPNVQFADGTTTMTLPLQQFNRAINGALTYSNQYWRWLQKLDAKVTDKDTVSVRYIIYDFANPGRPTAVPGQEIGQALRDQTVTLNYTRVFSPANLNESRLTYSRRANNYTEHLPAQVSITSSGLPTIGNQNYPQHRTDNVYEITDNLSMMRGRHTLRTGANVMRYDLLSFFAPSLMGALNYPSMADLLFDRAATWSQYAGTGDVPARTYEMGAFFQDDWRATQSLTLNLGARYEYTSTPFGFFSGATPDVNNIAPRVGFAIAPRNRGGLLGWLTGEGRMSIRGGYSIAYDQIFQNILLNNSRNFPRGVTVSTPSTTGGRFYDASKRPAPPTPDDYIRQGKDPNLLPVRLFSPDKRVKQPLGQQYSFGVERQLLANYVFRAFYIGSRGSGLVREVERNLGFTNQAVLANPGLLQPVISGMGLQPVLDSTGKVTSYRANPARGSILVGDGLAMSTYHSLQTTLEKRYSNGVQFEFNYTWSSFINDSDDILGGATNNTLPAVPFNFKLDRARSGLDVPHRAVANFIYEFPKLYANKRIVGRVTSGWMLSGIVTLQSGTPYTILNANNALGILPGQIGTIEGSQRASLYLNGAPFTAGPIVAGQPIPRYIANPVNSGIIGTLGRNTERTGGIANGNLALNKSTRLWNESSSLELRWEVFDVLNHRNFTLIPVNTAANSTNLTQFMNLGQTDVGGRSMIIAARIVF